MGLLDSDSEADYGGADISTENDGRPFGMMAGLLVRLMAPSLTGAPCTVGHAHVLTVFGQRVLVQMSYSHSIGEYVKDAEQSAHLAL